ncbi:MAG: hypothetical protein Q8M07_24360 [Prosthecobacter sp.]|nr:hypothetical protein [Prosthecobacter sp.]HBJ85455.1 hypothetical protein [Verrucomicrobiales bacterium]
MNEVPRKRWGCLEWGIVVGGIVLLVMLAIPARPGSHIGTQGLQFKAMHNCKQIILCLKQYAVDNGTLYPDGGRSELKSANQVFRELFKEEIISDERIFGCPVSKFNPDNELGRRPNFEKALMPGECHWMLLKNQTDTSHPRTPIIIENSLNGSWPPKWDVSQPFASWWSGAANKKKGRAWKGRRIIIARNDGSVAVEKLREDGTMDWHSASNLDEHGKSWIDSLTPEQIAKLAYWDIEEK